MGIIEQIIGIIVIGIGFAITLLYLMPVMIKDIKELYTETFFENKQGEKQ